MSDMVFFNLSLERGRMPIPNGTRLPIDQLLQMTAQAYPEVFAKHNLPLCLQPTTFEPTQPLQKTLQALCLAVSGCLPFTQDQQNVRRLLYALPNECKRSFVDPWHAMGLLTYLVVGFRTHPWSMHREDSNSIQDVAMFMERLVVSESAHMTSYLCTHRGPSVPGGSWLAESIPTEMAERALGLQLGLLENGSSSRDRSLTWIQQGPSLFASGSIFPELFLKYLERGKIADMLLVLAGQREQIQSVLALAGPSTKIPLELRDLDSFSVDLLHFMQSRYGRSWRKVDYLKEVRDGDVIWEIAVEATLSEIKRLMPFYSTDRQKLFEDLGGPLLQNNVTRAMRISDQHTSVRELPKLTERVIRWFAINQAMHPTAKALYETAFYYLWGKQCAISPGHFAVGIDRDHSLYQREAWRLGYAEVMAGDRRHVPLYARWQEKPTRKDYVHHLSFRQFWR